jgi:hypothetical protein
MLGEKYFSAPDSAERVFGRFNKTLKDKLLILFPETNGKNTFMFSDSIKNMIDGSGKILIEQKGVDAYDINNYMSFIFFSNHDNPIKIEKGDRRFVVINCTDERVKLPPEEKTKYFAEIIKLMDHGQPALYDLERSKKLAKIVYMSLLKFDLTQFDINNRPITEGYKEMERNQSSIINQYLVHVVSQMEEKRINGIENWDKKTYKVGDFFQNFMNWKNKMGFEKYEYNLTRFGLEIKKDFPCIKKISGNINISYDIIYEDITIYLQGKGFI